jgi:hypothetical protein
MLATSYQQTPDADWAFNLFGFSDTYGLLTWVIVMRWECTETGRKLPNEKQGQEMSDATKKTDAKTPMMDANYTDQHLTTLKDIQINIKGSV